MDQLRETGLLDRSVLVLYGDHQGFLSNPAELARVLGFSEQDEFRMLQVRKKVPLLIRLPYGEKAQIRTTASRHLDIAPTVLSLLGFKAHENVMLGRDLTTDQQSLVVFRDGSFTNGIYHLINRFGSASARSCSEIKTALATDCDFLERQRRDARERLEISDLIIRGNLIPVLHADAPSLLN